MAILNDLLVNGISRLIGPVYGASFIRHGGTSLQLLKANGSTLDFDTSVTTKFLRNDGQWAVPAGGGGGGGSTVTVPTSDITLSTTASTYITVDGTSRKMQLPASVPSTWLGTTSTACASGNHNHGNIDSAGQILNNVSISSGCRVAFINTDSKVARSSTVFGASSDTTTTKGLSQAGTWESMTNVLQNPTSEDYWHKVLLTWGSNYDETSAVASGNYNTVYCNNVSVLPRNGTIYANCFRTASGTSSQVVSGTGELRNAITIYTGTTTPSSSTGVNGDIYIQTS